MKSNRISNFHCFFRTHSLQQLVGITLLDNYLNCRSDIMGEKAIEDSKTKTVTDQWVSLCESKIEAFEREDVHKTKNHQCLNLIPPAILLHIGCRNAISGCCDVSELSLGKGKRRIEETFRESETGRNQSKNEPSRVSCCFCTTSTATLSKSTRHSK